MNQIISEKGLAIHLNILIDTLTYRYNGIFIWFIEFGMFYCSFHDCILYCILIVLLSLSLCKLLILTKVNDDYERARVLF